MSSAGRTGAGAPAAGVRVRLATPADLPAVLALRHEVFVRGQGVDPAIERDGLDATAVHAYAELTGPRGAADSDGGDTDRGDADAAGTDPADPGRVGTGERAGASPEAAGPVGTGRLVGAPTTPARVGRMAVRAGARGLGVGTAVLRRLEREALRRGHPAVELHAQSHARDFYVRAGYTPVGPEFTEAGIPHVAMRRELPRVRPVRDDDAADLIALIGGCWAEYPGCVLDVDGEEPWLRAPATAYARTGGRMWVADLDGRVVACVGVRLPDADTAELKSLYVAAAARRRGLGEALTALVEEDAAARGARRVELWSDTRFGDAHRLYARLGYRRVPGTRALHDLSGTHEYRFVRDLAAGV